ncbi:urease accessory protein UreF [Sphingobacterium psychroaquaticum]|uniref:Urease accessory protein UreF n=1 Tax=Sphingobacterium psychroaquaticum TaxID=561061 RepID=A0A1X7KDS2_9SPHI|nr:urease accessory protein UreF [Sphingobacterium psychroaquaticum]SMG39073.1 urease accessory protein [Sphingobacterium psychroaquaticum]
MEKSFLGKLLHLADPTLPIGAYTHSNGLETYVQMRLVQDKESADQYVRHNLWYNMKYNDAAIMKLAYEATMVRDIDSLQALDQECSALKSAKEIRQASQKLGLRLFKIFTRYEKDSLVEAWATLAKQRKVDSHYCVIYGMFACLLQIPLAEAMHAYYYNAAIGMVTNAVKLVPLGQLDGQDILFALHDDLETLCAETLLVERHLVGLCNVGFDIRCMQHERLYTRIYIS